MLGCKVIIEVPVGGKVVSENGVECLGGQTCVLDVTDTSFDDRFHAVPEDGFAFDQWQTGNGFFCGGSTLSCYLFTTSFAGNAALESFLAGDAEFHLSPVFTESTPRYDVSAWSEFLDGMGTSAFRSNSFLYQITPDSDNCEAGQLKTQATERFRSAVNLIRKLHYLPPVDYNSFYNEDVQQASLVQQANNYLTHSPSVTDNCYSSAAAAGAGSSNLSASSQQRDPASYAVSWANDNNNISSMMEAGHRRWLLYPNLGYTSFGQAGGYSAMKVFGFNQAPATQISADVEYIAFPYRNYPYVLVSKGSRPTPWSISMVPPSGVSAKFDHFSQSSVTVTETATGNPLTVHSVHSDTKGYGLANFFSWMVDDWDYDIGYTVTISNVQMPDNSVRQIQYNVEIDYADLL